MFIHIYSSEADVFPWRGFNNYPCVPQITDSVGHRLDSSDPRCSQKIESRAILLLSIECIGKCAYHSLSRTLVDFSLEEEGRSDIT